MNYYRKLLVRGANGLLKRVSPRYRKFHNRLLKKRRTRYVKVRHYHRFY